MVNVHVAAVASYRRYISSHWLYDNPQHFEDQNILNVPNVNIFTQVAGDVHESDRAGLTVLGSGAHHRIWLTA